MDACAAIEVVTSRYQDPDKVSNLEKLADGISNGGFVHGAALVDWRGMELGKLKVALTVNGTTVLEQVGGHPTGDPLGVAVTFVNMMRETERRSRRPVRNVRFVHGVALSATRRCVQRALRWAGRRGSNVHCLRAHWGRPLPLTPSRKGRGKE